ncbi:MULTISPECIES: DUF397 domain-containing protein [unclassified Streptomyces]|uniref:DUF397 domain-containing protein n=1 Tax=unclassified Streptomyces TaxID=2593676 RepID=UPI000DDBBAD1|nr:MULTISPECIES: DUF397 domain-containing protein [unclassified Streptomyces]QZZ29595.1 DUF397 domain-containing protein [Streptomyces sp. ST1015]
MIRKAPAGAPSELAWFKSSYSSGPSGEDCVEVALNWFKSSYSDGPSGDDCVEIATTPACVHIRDSKLRAASPTFQVAPTTWSTFISHTTSH